MNLQLETLDKDNQRLAWHFHVSRNSCDNPEYYDNYIRFSALSDFKSGFTTTSILIDSDADRIAGFFSLRATGIGSQDGEGHYIINRPALEIAELAVDKEYEREGIGTFLIDLVIKYADYLRKNCCGIRTIVLCADPKAVGFYEKNSFAKLSDTYDPMIKPETINCIPMYLDLPEL